MKNNSIWKLSVMILPLLFTSCADLAPTTTAAPTTRTKQSTPQISKPSGPSDERYFGKADFSRNGVYFWKQRGSLLRFQNTNNKTVRVRAKTWEVNQFGEKSADRDASVTIYPKGSGHMSGTGFGHNRIRVTEVKLAQ